MKTRAFLSPMLCLLMFLGVCAGLGAGIESPSSQAAQDTMNQVRQQYAAGQYGTVIRTVATSDDIATAPKSMRIEAYKLQAFSYCVRNYAQLCEDTFVRLLQLDKSEKRRVVKECVSKWRSRW